MSVLLPDPAFPRPARAANLADRFGRVATDLRVSLTDKCNLRCTYCMPAEGLAWLSSDRLLSDDEILRLVRIAVELLGVEEVRFTGGEPLIRPGLVRIVEATAGLGPRPAVSLTTNGIGLDKTAQALVDAGLTRINVSLDTLDRERFIQLTRRDRLDQVLAGLQRAQAAGLAPVKVNTVLMRDVNDHEAVDLLRFCRDHGYELRFIEQMPLDAQHGWSRTGMVTAAEILDRLSKEVALTPTPQARGAAPAETWLVDGGPDVVGVIASVTRPFCTACDRTRLTADGQVRSCLFARTETDLRELLRGDATDEDIADVWRDVMWGKGAGHQVGDQEFVQPDRPMSAIGG